MFIFIGLSCESDYVVLNVFDVFGFKEDIIYSIIVRGKEIMEIRFDENNIGIVEGKESWIKIEELEELEEDIEVMNMDKVFKWV